MKKKKLLKGATAFKGLENLLENIPMLLRAVMTQWVTIHKGFNLVIGKKKVQMGNLNAKKGRDCCMRQIERVS